MYISILVLLETTRSYLCSSTFLQQFFVRGIIILKWYKSEVKCWASLCLSEEMEGLLSTIIQNGVMGIYRFCIDADNTNNTYTIHSIQLTSSVLRIQNVLQSSAHMALQWSEWLRVVKLRPLPPAPLTTLTKVKPRSTIHSWNRPSLLPANKCCS